MSVKSFKTGTRSVSLLAGNVPEHHVLIAESVGSGGAASVTFSNIPADYQHLQIRGVMRNTNTGTSLDSLAIRLNGSTSLNDYAEHYLLGNATSATAGGITAGPSGNGYIQTRQCICPNNTSSTPNTVGAIIIDLLDYASTSKNKTVRTFGGIDTNATLGQAVFLTSGLYLQTTAVSSISLINFGSNWGTTTAFALYGVK